LNMKSWLKKQIAQLTDLQAHPEPDQGVFEGCASVIREAADRAAKDGFIDLYERHKKTRFCSPRDAVAILNSMLAVLRPEPEYLTVEQAATQLQVSRDSIYDLINQGLLKHTKVGRIIRIQPADLDHIQGDGW
jgi:excisionase family DNA binding protein